MLAGGKTGKWLAGVSGWRGLPLAAGISVALAVVFGSVTLGFLDQDRSLKDQRMMTTNNLGVLRAHLEGALNSRLLLGRGLVSYVAIHPDISQEEFQVYAAKLVGNDPIIRNISLVKKTVIMAAYPLRGNEKAIGVDLYQIPAQRAAIQKAIDTRKSVIDGPVDLVQGGRGLISRVPIFTDSKNDGPASDYWGQASIVLMQDALLAEAGLTDGAYGLSCALRRRKDEGLMKEAFWGNEAIYAKDPVTLDIIFPNGSWQLAAIPAEGWGAQDSSSRTLAIVGGLLGLAAGYLVYRILGASRKIQELESILPICSNCKKVRDDRGYWDQVESYLATTSKIKFTHGLCPDCVEKLYGREDWYKAGKVRPGPGS